MRTLCLECWKYTDVKMSSCAGRALDESFLKALDERRHDTAIQLMLPCWLRNDTKNVETAAYLTLKMAVQITTNIKRQIVEKDKEHSDTDEARELERNA